MNGPALFNPSAGPRVTVGNVELRIDRHPSHAEQDRLVVKIGANECAEVGAPVESLRQLEAAVKAMLVVLTKSRPLL